LVEHFPETQAYIDRWEEGRVSVGFIMDEDTDYSEALNGYKGESNP
jgi:hypothetical protein